MASAASLRNVSLGRYWPGESGVHRLDPRAKLLTVALLTIAIVVASRWWLTAAILLLLILAFRLADLPWAAVGGALRPVLPVLGLLAVFQLLFGYEPVAAPGVGVLLVSIGRYSLSLGRVVGVLISLCRLLSLVLLVNLLTSTTAPSALVAGLEMLFRPLSRVGLPGHELALTGAIALRFLPILGEELESVQRAQLARDISGGPERSWQIARNARRTAALIVPLFADAFRRVDELTTAMLARCYQGGRGRTYLRHLQMGTADHAAVGAGLALLVIAFVF
ncbi:MAG: energy-coupling factor transporter transmembrane component T family protein [Anaerolineae bacterium]